MCIFRFDSLLWMGVFADFFFLFNMRKNGVFGADFEIINTRFYHWEVLWKNVSHSTYIYIQIFILFPKLLCIMKHYCDINESGFKFHFYSLFWRGPPRKTLRKLHQNGVFWAHFEVLINQNGPFYNWKFIRKKCFSLYIDYMYTCISIIFWKYSYTLAFEFDRKHYFSVYFY